MTEVQNANSLNSFRAGASSVKCLHEFMVSVSLVTDTYSQVLNFVQQKFVTRLTILKP